jgi:AraC family transcriptional regulator of adaptative response / methylphosphotriester-DNA alkyltransferase methyltransferase
MNKNFTNPDLTIAEVAQVSNISEVYFRQLFKKATGQLPNRYILNLRVNHASFLLQSSKYKVTEIAMKAGFSDTKYFMTTFKKMTGYSPQKYRQLHN